MALNTSGPISLGGSDLGQSIALELSLGATTTISLNDTDVRTLANIALGAITMPTDFWGKSAYRNTQRGFIGNGGSSIAPINLINLISDTGIIATATASSGSVKGIYAGCSYGGDKGVTAYGVVEANDPYLVNVKNLVSNTGVQSADQAGVGSPRYNHAACGYGGDKGIFLFGQIGGSAVSISNLVSNAGVIASDITLPVQGRYGISGATFGEGKGVTAFGGVTTLPSRINVMNIVSDVGVVGSDISTAGQLKRNVAACSFGGDRAYFFAGSLSGNNDGRTSVANIISNTGVMSSNITTGLLVRTEAVGVGYGGDKGTTFYGTGAGSVQNLINNLGIISSNIACAGPSNRKTPGACGYSFT